MIGFLRGKIISWRGTRIVLEAGGVGYEVQVSKTASESLSLESPASFWIWTALRQDSLELFGFARQEEKQLFLSLLKVNRIGPKMAMNLLGCCELERFVKMIREGDTKALSALPGVGKKMAQQMALTLKDEISAGFAGLQEGSQKTGRVIRALETLGFGAMEIKEALDQIKWTQNLEADIKQALSILGSFNKGGDREKESGGPPAL